MTGQEREYLYLLCRMKGLGAVTIRKLWEELGSFQAAYYIEETAKGEDLPALKRVERLIR